MGLSPEPTAGESQPRLRVGVMYNGRLERWQADCIDQLLAVPGVEPALVINENRVASAGATGRGGVLFRLWWGLQGGRARQSAALPAPLEFAPRITCKAEHRPDGSMALSELDAATIRGHRLDVLLYLGSIAPQGSLELARHGLWSFQHGDPEKYPAWPPCFWEVYHGDSVGRSVLRRPAADPDAEVVLREAFLPVRNRSYTRTADAALSESAQWPAQACRDLLGGITPPRAATRLAPVAKTGRLPGNFEMLRFIGRQWRARFWWIAELLFRHGDWNVGIVRAPIASFLKRDQPRAVEWLAGSTRGDFVADPFGVVHRGKLTILCEEYDSRRGLGRIVSVDSTAQHPRSPVTIGPELHRSYPYLFHHDGEIYCVPETYQARKIALYRAAEFPARWDKVTTLVRDVAALDSTLVQFDGRWWLWCVDYERGAQAELFLYHSPDLFGPWTAHPGNPVKTDIRSARPAGTPFVHEGILYRPAQDCSRTYGGRVVINRVTCLTPTAFAEEPVALVEPDPAGPYPDGLHTLSAVGSVTLVDGKRVVFDSRECFRAAKQLLQWVIAGRLRRAISDRTRTSAAG